MEDPEQIEGEENVLQVFYPTQETKSENGVNLLRRFDFSSSVMRSSAICRGMSKDKGFRAFVKGAPEKIKELCINNIPSNYDTIMESHTREGYRVIAIATKELKGFSNS